MPRKMTKARRAEMELRLAGDAMSFYLDHYVRGMYGLDKQRAEYLVQAWQRCRDKLDRLSGKED